MAGNGFVPYIAPGSAASPLPGVMPPAGAEAVTLSGVNANASVALPGNVMLVSISIRETSGVAMGGNVNIGTSAGAADVVSVPVGADGVVPISAASLNNYAWTAPTTLYISASEWGGTLNIKFNYVGIN